METPFLRSLSLRNFRNYRRLDLDFHEGFHVFAGQNGHGKTNLLEALYFLGTTRLLRGMRDHEAILHGEAQCSVAAEVGNSKVSLSLETGSRKKAALNGMSLPRAADLIGRLPCVCVSSLDLLLVKGEPSDRRLFLDLELSQSSAGYLRHFSLYKRALEQRNALLRQANESYLAAENFEPWEIQIAHHGSALREARRDFILNLEPLAQDIHALLGDGERASMKYEPKDDFGDEDSLRTGLFQTRQQDILRKSTTIGPHRDELRIYVNDSEARLFASQGQQRSIVLAIKLGTMQLLTQWLGRVPLLLLDDILSDLDAARRSHLSTWILSHASQTVLTCTEASAVSQDVLDRATVMVVKDGEISG